VSRKLPAGELAEIRRDFDAAMAKDRGVPQAREMARIVGHGDALLDHAAAIMDERDGAREKLRALVEAASALCRDAANRGELKDEMRDSWDACFNAIAAARGVL